MESSISVDVASSETTEVIRKVTDAPESINASTMSSSVTSSSTRSVTVSVTEEATPATSLSSVNESFTETDEIVEEVTEIDFVPPSIPDQATQDIHDSFTYLTKVPIKAQAKEPCILGVDEAGRGPVVGPMVYALSYCPVSFAEDLKKVGFADSKQLNHTTRTQLLRQMCEDSDLVGAVGWGTTVMTARDIAMDMLRPESHGVVNLNQQAHDTTMQLIQRVLDLGVNVTEIYVDTVGHPQKYQAKLSARFPGIDVTVAKKADSLYPIVSAASICAKVTRDAYLVQFDESGGTWGSGYPSDPKTAAWLKGSMDPVFGWGSMVRFSWRTTQDALQAGKDAVLVEWTDDYVRKNSSIKSAFSRSRRTAPSPSPLTTSGIRKRPMSTRYYGAHVTTI
uniref:Ribonuclease n=1 Tax=Blastobotrys adeninivorans TaxID=409370 RepID=A0A060TAQ0_BLAAD